MPTSTTQTPKIKVLVVDDSATVRQVMTQILNSDPAIEVIATAADPYIAVARIKENPPDVITLDLEMPRMDGLTFLGKIMSNHPIPTVICSTLTESGSEAAINALEQGAVEIITKPKIGTEQFFEESRARICETIKSAARVELRKLRINRPASTAPSAPIERCHRPPAGVPVDEKIVAIGASTGGTEALRELLEVLPGDSPGIVVVQHLQEKFTARFAERLDRLCRMTVKEAEHGDYVERGQVLIAPGSRHMVLKNGGGRYHVELNDGPPVSHHRPSVDILFKSAAQTAGSNCIGVILTGMGDDGARGMLEMKQAGAVNIAQNEESCVIFGMPAEAIKHGGVDHTLPLNEIASAILHLCH